MSVSSRIRIVMINTFHPGNIGAAARAMKNMGLNQLYLVDPQDYPSEEAESRAAGAKDLLEKAVVVSSLDEAIADCPLVIGTSARMRSDPWPMLTPEECAKKVTLESHSAPVALVFGRETMGLLNEELRKCNFHVCIPANPDYPVLNVSSAIQLLCYEIFKLTQSHQSQVHKLSAVPKYVEYREMDRFMGELEKILRDVGFLMDKHPGRTMIRIKRLVNRLRPEAKEMKILWGIVSSVQDMVKSLRLSDGQEGSKKD